MEILGEDKSLSKSMGYKNSDPSVWHTVLVCGVCGDEPLRIHVEAKFSV